MTNYNDIINKMYAHKYSGECDCDCSGPPEMYETGKHIRCKKCDGIVHEKST